MPFLDPDAVLGAAGYTKPAGGWDANSLAAVAFAEAAIEGYTGAVWYGSGGNPAAATLRVRIDGKRRALPLPRDFVTVTAVVPAPSSSYSQVLSDLGLELWDDAATTQADMIGLWDEGPYKITGTRGFTPDDRANRAAALLAAYFLRLPDPERSAYRSLSEGDFSGAYRPSNLGVPEAEDLLAAFRATAARVGG